MYYFVICFFLMLVLFNLTKSQAIPNNINQAIGSDQTIYFMPNKNRLAQCDYVFMLDEEIPTYWFLSNSCIKCHKPTKLGEIIIDEPSISQNFVNAKIKLFTKLNKNGVNIRSYQSLPATEKYGFVDYVNSLARENRKKRPQWCRRCPRPTFNGSDFKVALECSLPPPTVQTEDYLHKTSSKNSNEPCLPELNVIGDAWQDRLNHLIFYSFYYWLASCWNNEPEDFSSSNGCCSGTLSTCLGKSFICCRDCLDQCCTCCLTGIEICCDDDDVIYSHRSGGVFIGRRL